MPDLPQDTRKPVINPSRTPLDVIEKFEDWYVNLQDEGINIPYVMDIWLEPDPTREGYFVYDDTLFFPLDAVNENPGDVQAGDGGNYNFLFTTELHTAFEYKGGEVFTFRGDDDVFAFINGKLAVDIGGIHGPVERSVNLDAQAATLGLEIGNVYSLELFQAERNPGGSNYRIDTSLDFKECGILEDDIVVK
jgi:fibro-slime domain-containing protein